MKLLQFVKDSVPTLGVKTSKGILDVREAAAIFKTEIPFSTQELIEKGDTGLSQLQSLIEKAESGASEALFLQEDDVVFAPAVTTPEKVLCVGLNYINHAKEAKLNIPESPILFSKFNNALAAHHETVSIPEEAEQMDYEAELVVVIGKTAKNVSKEEALSHVFGYAVGNDLSARDLQFKSGQWLLGKSPDGFAPIGPYITTSDDIPNPQNLNVQCRINGETRQNGNTKDMIFDCATIISYISQTMTLKPGDVIYTGTPDGVVMGYPDDQKNWLKSGDEMIVSIEGLGELKNTLS